MKFACRNHVLPYRFREESYAEGGMGPRLGAGWVYVLAGGTGPDT
jgi:hypothetical protein